MTIVIIILIFISLGLAINDWKKDKKASFTFSVAGAFLIFCLVALKMLT